MDEPTQSVVMHRTEPSRLQSMSLQLADKLANLVDNNERILKIRQGTTLFHHVLCTANVHWLIVLQGRLVSNAEIKMCVSETDLSMATGKDNKAEAIGSAEVEIIEITVTTTTTDCFSL